MKKTIIILQLLVFLALVACSNTTTIATTTETSTFQTTSMSDHEVLDLILESVVIPQETVEDIVLLDSYSVGEYTATASWTSTASNVINSSGVITPNIADKTAVLVLTLHYNSEILKHNFNITVLGNEDFLLLYLVVNSLVEVPLVTIYEDIVLPNEYIYNNKVIQAEWLSSNENIVTSDGIVTLGSSIETVEFELTLEYNNLTRIEYYTFTIGQDESLLPINWWHTTDVYQGVIENEASKPYTPSCYSGAVYRKVVSSEDYWLGIEATLTIPEFTPDPLRYDDSKLSYFLDNASIYMGGNAYYESDVGLTWSIGYTPDNDYQVSRQGIAFRPFWRYITSAESCTNNNCYRNADPFEYEYYYYPGDTIKMSVVSPQPGYLQLRIELISETENPAYASIRDEYGLGDDFNKIFVTEMFPSAGMGVQKAEFKRVNAIDQVSNEGKATLNTNATVLDAIWHEVYLYRKIDDVIYRVPMTSDRTASMVCPLGVNVNGDFSEAFEISYEGVDPDLGGEVISLHPNNGDGTLYNVHMYIQRKEEYINL